MIDYDTFPIQIFIIASTYTFLGKTHMHQCEDISYRFIGFLPIGISTRNKNNVFDRNVFQMTDFLIE